MMNDPQKKVILKVARDTVEAVIGRRAVARPKSDDPELNAHCGCFVTLKNGEQLRGCIGQFVAERPLIEVVAEMAKASATGDPRFFGDPITTSELEELDIEISVLSPFGQRLLGETKGASFSFYTGICLEQYDIVDVKYQRL